MRQVALIWPLAWRGGRGVGVGAVQYTVCCICTAVLCVRVCQYVATGGGEGVVIKIALGRIFRV